jgi:hypothetical protein
MFWKGARRARAELAPGSPRLTIEPKGEDWPSQFIGHPGFTTKLTSSGAKRGLGAPMGNPPPPASLVPEPIDFKYESSRTPPSANDGVTLLTQLTAYGLPIG